MYSAETVKNSQPSMSPKESQRIEKDMIERLYHRDIDKFLKSKGSNVSDEKKFDYQNELRVDSYRHDKLQFNSPKNKLYSPKNKSNSESIDNNSNSNRLKNTSHFTFNKPTSGRSINTNNNNYVFDEENNYNYGRQFNEAKPQYSTKIKHNLIREQSEYHEQEYADSLRQFKFLFHYF